MKVLLLNPHPGRFEVPVYPLGLASLGAALKGHELEGCDLQLEQRPLAHLRRKLRDVAPEVVALSLRNVDSSASYDGFSYLPALEACLAEIRRTCPETTVVVGGPGFSLFARAIMKRFPEIDLGVVFEGDLVVPELLRSLDRPHAVRGVCYRADGGVHVNGRGPEVDFAALDPPDRILFRVGDYVARGGRIGVQTRRGCAFRCVYCTYPFLDGRAIRARRPTDVVDEIEELVGEGANELFFCDSIFNFPTGHAEGVCAEILRRGLDIRFFAFFNESAASREQLELARDAGCDLAIFGPDAGHPTTLETYRKGHTLARLEQAYRWCRELGLPYKCAFLMNGPGETMTSFAHMLAFVLRLRLAAGLRFSFSTMRIYPHTELHRLAVEQGLVDADDDLLEARYFNPPPLGLPSALVSAAGRALGGVLRLVRWARAQVPPWRAAGGSRG